MNFLDNIGLERLWAHIILGLSGKVNKVDGKGLSTEDFTTEEKNNLQNVVETFADKNYVDEKIAEIPSGFSGDYNDLTNKPVIPSKVSELENDSNFANKTEIENLQNKIDILNGTGEGSVKDTIADAVATIVANAPEDFDTLKEVATWIENDTLGTADLLNRMTAVEENVNIQSDWNQEDDTQKDFIKNKPDFEGLKSQVAELSGSVESYLLNIDYDATLAFDTTEIIFNSTTSSILGQAILGQMVLT